jgi:hypothetical protein
MSFTQDELQALHAIFDQKMAILRRDLDRSLDQRMQLMRREFDQRQTSILQDLLRGLARRQNEQQHRVSDALYQRLDGLQSRIVQTLQQEFEQKHEQQRQQLEQVVDRALAAQLLAIEQLINQQPPTTEIEASSTLEETIPSFDAIEVQTEIPWDDLVELIDKVLAERLHQMNNAIQTKLQDLERALVVQLHILRDQLQRSISAPSGQHASNETASGNLTTIQEIFTSIEQLERLIESMQVTMTANSALLSNRLYYHQQLPAERAHPAQSNDEVDLPPLDDAANPHEPTPLPFPRKLERE